MRSRCAFSRSISPIPYGYNGCSGFLRENCEPNSTKIIPLDRKKMTAEFAPGIVIPLHPFFGSMGVAPPPGVRPREQHAAGMHAGNLDNRELVAGTTLFIPVHVPGALFEVGDGHAAQGDGEVDQTAIETSLRGRLQLTVRKGHDARVAARRDADRLHQHGHRRGPHQGDAESPSRRWSISSSRPRGLDKLAAYQLTSIAGNVVITQLVDQKVGVHVKMPKRIFR